MGEDANSLQLRVDAVGKGEIDDAVDAAERYRGLGAMFRQRIEPLALAPRQDQRKRVLDDGARTGSTWFQPEFLNFINPQALASPENESS